MKNVVAYHRVSPTRIKKEQIENENRPLNEIIKEEMHKSLISSVKICKDAAQYDGHQITHDYIDEYKSGKSQEHMSDFNQMMDDARNGKIDRIYCRRVNRFGRNRSQTMKSLLELEDLGISIKFVENGLDTGMAFGKSIIGFMAELAEMERESIIENIERGKQEAREAGVKFGRKPKEIDVKTLRRIRTAPIGERSTWTECEELFGVPRNTLIRHLKKAGYWDYDRRCVI